ncbi:MAG: DUF2284 domain-containing protein [Bacteroidales bacterium]|nr:DUF2284 domain-containing protein [Bacteroidales bacterium]
MYKRKTKVQRAKHKIVKILAPNYIEEYCNAGQFIEQCKECSNYGNMWACPPFDYDTLATVSDYKYAHIIGSQIFISEATRYAPADATEHNTLSYQIMEQARSGIDGQLLGLENRYSGSLCFFAGSCLLCPKEECTRLTNSPCAHPTKMRPSLEAYGFDISKTTLELLGIELKWSTGLVLPPYFTFVSALFTNHKIDNLEL